ncbi:MAG: DUF4097 domain-containing protein [bacterium]
MKRLLIFPILVILGLLTIHCDDDLFDPVRNNNDVSVDSTFVRTFDKSGITSISVSSINGAIEVYGTEADSIEIEAQLKVQAPTVGSAREGINLIQVRFSFSGSGELRIDTVIPQNDSRNFQVSYVLTVPIDLPIIAETINGAIVVDSLNASFEGNTTNGAINVRNVLGEVRTNTTNGAVFMENIQGEVRARTTNGAIAAKNIMPDKNTIDLQITNGPLSLSVPVTISATVSARTTNGTVSISNLNIDLTVNEPNHKEGQIGEGDATIRLRTTNGNINISGI